MNLTTRASGEFDELARATGAAIFDPKTSELLQIGVLDYLDIARQERAVHRARVAFDTFPRPCAASVAALRDYYEQFRDLEAMRDKARSAFVEKIGCSVGAPFTLDELRASAATSRATVNLCDAFVGNADYLWAHGKPTAVIGHTLRTWSEAHEFGTSQGLRVDPLPGSWAGPGIFVAVLYTRRDYVPTQP